MVEKAGPYSGNGSGSGAGEQTASGGKANADDVLPGVSGGGERPAADDPTGDADMNDAADDGGQASLSSMVVYLGVAHPTTDETDFANSVDDETRSELEQAGYQPVTCAPVDGEASHGIEDIIDGAANDTTAVRDGVNVMAGGLGGDSFVFFTIGAIHGDAFCDLHSGDRVELSEVGGFDALDGDQSFTLMDQPTISALGHVNFRQEQAVDGKHAPGQSDDDRDRPADPGLDIDGRPLTKPNDFFS